MAIRRKWCAGAIAMIVAVVAAACSSDDGSPQPAPTPAPTYPTPAPVTGSVLAHDPAVVKRPDGTYLLAYTGNGIPMKTSKDRKEFTEADSAFPDGAPWTTEYTNGSTTLWAPDLSYQNGKYLLFYSASTFGSNHSAIFLATSPSGKPGSWKNEGLVIESNKPDNFNAIDPNLYVDPSGRWWLTFGSFWSGIQLVELDPKTGKRLDTTPPRNIAGRGGDAIEAPFLIRRGTYYYLFVSFDKCCQGPSSTYRIMVGRATDPTGPYVDKAGKPMTEGGGTEILAGQNGIHGPGHQAVLTDTDGDVLFYHHYAGNGNGQLGVNQLAYDDAGWPVVR